jgi:hypothetical protein
MVVVNLGNVFVMREKFLKEYEDSKQERELLKKRFG